MGNIESLGRGAVQYLSAGKGIVHSEMNNGDKTCRFLQTWFLPDKSGHKPQYGSRSYTKEDRHNVLLQLLGGTGNVPKWSSVKSDLQAAALHQVHF
jgi:redox-sensitive bicupin YhaK (pirin superfamily)